MHWLFTHVSVVHKLLSSHTAANAAPVFGVVMHPSFASQEATKHLSVVVQLLEMSVYTHTLFWQSSDVHLLLSLHKAAIAVSDFLVYTHPSV